MSHAVQPNQEKSASPAAKFGLIGAPLLAVLLYALLTITGSGLSQAGCITAAIAVLMAVLWLTEAIPLAATALLPILLFPLCGIMPIRNAAAPYARELIFLFMGGFMLALAMQRWNLHRRIALLIVYAVGTNASLLIAGMMIATAFLSAWISNTATTVMMLPIGLNLASLLAQKTESETDDDVSIDAKKRFALCLMLGIAYAASIGGNATIVGSPPNLVLVTHAKDSLGIDIGFGQWMMLGVPLACTFLVLTWLLLTQVLFPVRMMRFSGGRDLIRQELKKMGAPSRGELSVLTVFGLTALAWMFRAPLTKWVWLTDLLPAIKNLHDAGIALAAALALFVISVDFKKGVRALDWETAAKLPWGMLILFGGGLSLSEAFRTSGLSQWIGQQVAPLGSLHVFFIVLATTLAVLYLTELTSNTATASAFFPILIGVASGLDANPLLLLLPAGLAANCAFMMPVATPPNAIVFGSGHVTIRQMVHAGFWLNLIGLALIMLISFGAVALGIL